jgi:hypothetical protein
MQEKVHYMQHIIWLADEDDCKPSKGYVVIIALNRKYEPVGRPVIIEMPQRDLLCMRYHYYLN